MSEGDAVKDYYELLGTREDATRDEIVRRFRRRAAEHHPDRGGDEERMKELNEAYRVLGDEGARAAYDARRRDTRSAASDDDSMNGDGWGGARFADEWLGREWEVADSARAAQADAVWGRVAGAGATIFAGLVLLLLVRTHYVVFLFPLAMLAAALVFFGVWMAHAAMVFARARFNPTHFARRFVWAQELVFWSTVAGGIGGVYVLLTSF
jgi:hypothetical protein